jgi:hypothetical protein
VARGTFVGGGLEVTVYFVIRPIVDQARIPLPGRSCLACRWLVVSIFLYLPGTSFQIGRHQRPHGVDKMFYSVGRRTECRLVLVGIGLFKTDP